MYVAILYRSGFDIFTVNTSARSNSDIIVAVSEKEKNSPSTPPKMGPRNSLYQSSHDKN